MPRKVRQVLTQRVAARREGGYGLTQETMRVLAEIVRRQHTHPLVRETLLDLWQGVDPRDFQELTGRVLDFVATSVRYQRDPVGAEYITEPVTLLEQIEQGRAAEDCESMALLAATLLAAGGISSAFQIEGRDPSRPLDFRHCALVAFDPKSGNSLVLDPVGRALHGEAWGLGDTMAKPGDPVELWDALAGSRLWRTAMTIKNLLGDLGCDCGRGLGDAVSFFDDVAKDAAGVADQFGLVGKAFGGAIRAVDGAVDTAAGRPPRNVRARAVAPSPPKSSSPSSAVKVLGGGAAALGLLKLLSVI